MINLTHREKKVIVQVASKQSTEKQKVLTAFQMGVEYALTKHLPEVKVAAILKPT